MTAENRYQPRIRWWRLLVGFATIVLLTMMAYLLLPRSTVRDSADAGTVETGGAVVPTGGDQGRPAVAVMSDRAPQATTAVGAEPRTGFWRSLFRSGAGQTGSPGDIVRTYPSGARSIRLKTSGNRVFATGLLAAMITILDGSDDEKVKATIQKALRDIYSSYGFIRAKIEVEAIDGEADTFSVSIDEGVVFRWSALTVRSDSLPVSSLLPNFTIEQGQPANFPEFRQNLNSLALRYQERGYLDFNYSLTQKIDDAGAQVAVTVRVVEGLRYVISEVDLPLPVQSIGRLIGQPYSESLVEYHLLRAGLSLQNISLELNKLNGTVALRTKRP